MKPAILSNRYYLKFGLDRDPFPPNFTQNKLFLTHEVTHLMDELLCAIRTTGETLVVESSAGGGKSVLAEYLNFAKEANWYLSLIQASEKTGKTELAHAIISQHFPKHRFEKTRSDVILREFLQLYQRNGKLPVVVIDDAHLLPEDTLKFVFEIASLQYEDEHFRMILFADKSLARKLGHPSLKAINSAQAVYKHIPSFSKSQTAKYMEHRISLSGQCKFKPFDDAAIEQIFRGSAGKPGEINRSARKYMKDFVIPGRTKRIIYRSASSIAAGLLLFVAGYAGMTGNGKQDIKGAPVSIALNLPKSERATVAPVEKKHTAVKARIKISVKNNDHRKQSANLVSRKTPAPNNKNVLLADMKRQSDLKARRIALEKKK